MKYFENMFVSKQSSGLAFMVPHDSTAASVKREETAKELGGERWYI